MSAHTKNGYATLSTVRRVLSQGSQGLRAFPEESENPAPPENPCQPCDPVAPVTPETPEISDPAEAVWAALPKARVAAGRGFRLAVFRLAKFLKAVPDLKDGPASALRPWVKRWHEQSKPWLGKHTFTDVYAEFVSVWKAVKYAAGDNIVKAAWNAIADLPTPPEAEGHDDPRVGQLINLCKQLQVQRKQECGKESFHLSGHLVAGLLGISQPTASAWLNMLVVDEILDVIDDGRDYRGGRWVRRVVNGKRQAKEYRLTNR